MPRVRFIRLVVFGTMWLPFVLWLTPLALAQTRKVFVPGTRAVVFDERLAALRARPDVKAPLTQRLRRGRRIGILATLTTRSGAKFYRVAVSRNTRAS